MITFASAACANNKFFGIRGYVDAIFESMSTPSEVVRYMQFNSELCEALHGANSKLVAINSGTRILQSISPFLGFTFNICWETQICVSILG